MKILAFYKYGFDFIERPFEIVGIPITYINFDSTELEDLKLVAKYRIVQYPTSILIRKTKVLFRISGMIPSDYIENYKKTFSI